MQEAQNSYVEVEAKPHFDEMTMHAFKKEPGASYVSQHWIGCCHGYIFVPTTVLGARGSDPICQEVCF